MQLNLFVIMSALNVSAIPDDDNYRMRCDESERNNWNVIGMRTNTLNRFIAFYIYWKMNIP